MTSTLSDFANSANKRQTTVTMNQILTQKWFYFRTYSTAACLVELQ
jgi:hypothetical protein